MSVTSIRSPTLLATAAGRRPRSSTQHPASHDMPMAYWCTLDQRTVAGWISRCYYIGLHELTNWPRLRVSCRSDRPRQLFTQTRQLLAVSAVFESQLSVSSHRIRRADSNSTQNGLFRLCCSSWLLLQPLADCSWRPLANWRDAFNWTDCPNNLRLTTARINCSQTRLLLACCCCWRDGQAV